MDLEKLDNAINELHNQTSNLVEFNKVYSEIGKLKKEITEDLLLLKQNNATLSTIVKEIKKRLDESHKQIEKIEAVLNAKIKEIYKDNKQYQKELDSSIFSRLEKHKSDIQLEIREEGKQIQRILESSLAASFNSVILKIDDKFEEQEKRYKKQNVLILILIFLVLVLIGLHFLVK